jgi:hypothetical protein
MTHYSAMDPALDKLSAFAPDLSNSFTNHAPMAIEAMCALGRGDAALPWLEQNWQFRSALLPRQRPTHPFDDWKAALGNGRSEDWAVALEADFVAGHWREGVTAWTERLAPGVSAAALHGFIRVGHAVRSLLDAETPLRRHELRDAFAYWAAHYSAIPEAPGKIAPVPVAAVLARVNRVPVEKQRRAGAITSALLVLHAGFAPLIDLLDVSGRPADVLSELTETFARVYLANAVDNMGVITFIHAMTGPVALRSLLPILPEETARRMVRYLWQACAALYAALGVAPPLADHVVPPAEDIAAMIDRAVATNDEHAIKFTEALLREHAIRPSPVYLAAAEHAIRVLGQ